MGLNMTPCFLLKKKKTKELDQIMRLTRAFDQPRNGKTNEKCLIRKGKKIAHRP